MYEAYFQLNERPFSISPDPRFFYLTAQHREALTNCQYMITNRVGPVYVHGDVGTGKTTIARRLYQQLHDDPKYISPFAPSGSNSLNFKLLIESGTPSQPLQDILL
jgi:type II secretory pathway predicted ATPase ExeA